MYVRNILLGGAAALSASAMLVVPEMEDTIEDGFVNVASMFPETLDVALTCNNCPFREVGASGDVSWTDGKPSDLRLQFEINENRLMANGRQIFPPVSPSPIYALQELEDGETSDPMPVGYALEVMPLFTPAEEEGELLEVRFTVLDLENHPVPVDTVAISLIQESSGDLHIAGADIEKTAPPPEALSWKKCHGSPKCLQELILSRVRGLFASAKDRFVGMAHKAGRKGCHGKPKGLEGMMDGPHGRPGFKGMHPPPGEFDGPEGDRDFHRGPHHKATEGDHEHPHGPHHGHHGHHGEHHGGPISHTFSRVVRFIIVPAILGVLAGLTACAVGMLVGQAVVFIWQSYRGTKRGEHKAAWEGESCEKQGLMTEVSEDVLPAYTDEIETRKSMDKI